MWENHGAPDVGPMQPVSSIRKGGDALRGVSMGKYFIKETGNQKIKLKSKHERLTQYHTRAIFNFLPDRSACFHRREGSEWWN